MHENGKLGKCAHAASGVWKNVKRKGVWITNSVGVGISLLFVDYLVRKSVTGIYNNWAMAQWQ